MNKNYTHITFILDRSGSMYNVWNDIVGGYKAIIKEQQKLKGKCTFSLVAFDDKQDVIEDMTDISKVSPDLKVNPRGSTALCDTVGANIVSLGEQLAKLPEKSRPGKVLFMIQTDGHENSSKEYTWAKVKELITHQQDVYKWQFMFLGADPSSIKQADSLGISSKMTSTYSNVENFTKGLNSKMLQARSISCDAYHNGEASMGFTESEKKELNS